MLRKVSVFSALLVMALALFSFAPAPARAQGTGYRNNFLVAFDVLGQTRDHPSGPGLFFDEFVVESDYVSLTCTSNYAGMFSLWQWANDASGGPTTLGEVDCYPEIVIDSIACSGATYVGGPNIGTPLPVGMPYTEYFSDASYPEWVSHDVQIPLGSGNLSSGTISSVLHGVADDFGDYQGHLVQSISFHFQVRKQYANLICDDWGQNSYGYYPINLRWIQETQYETYCDTQFTYTFPSDFSY
jgi:hypothetical protein